MAYFEGDIVVYNMDAYGFDMVVHVEILEVLEFQVKVRPIDGRWPEHFDGWKETEALSTDYIVDILYTIAPSTPGRRDESYTAIGA